jgi:hypothetical protein
MKQEYKDKFCRVRKWLNEDITGLPDEEIRQADIMHYNLIEELAKSKAPEVLLELFDFYTEKNGDLGGFDEMMNNAVMLNYSVDQILEALYKKSDLRGGCFMMRTLARWIWAGGFFEDFRKMFNTVKAKCSEEFLRRMDYPSDLWLLVSTLREDMKRWPGERAQAQIPTLKG